MKKILKSAFIIAVLSSQITYGATINVNNTASGFGSNLIVDNVGTALDSSSGSVQVGFFTDGDSGVTSATSTSTLFDSFQEFPATTSGEFINNALFTSGGGFAFEGDLDITDGSGNESFQDQNIYLVISNNLDSSAADEFFVFRFDELFVPPVGISPEPTTALLGGNSPSSGEVLIGRDLGGPNLAIGNLDSVADPTFGTVALVPEPSTSAILGLGGLAFLLRRRR